MSTPPPGRRRPESLSARPSRLVSGHLGQTGHYQSRGLGKVWIGRLVALDKEDRKAILKKSVKQEKRSAGAYKGSRNAGSGSGWLRKNDVRSETLLIENKFTTGTKSITIKEIDLRELRQRAIIEDRIPILQFDLNNRGYVVLVEDDFLAMIEEQNE